MNVIYHNLIYTESFKISHLPCIKWTLDEKHYYSALFYSDGCSGFAPRNGVFSHIEWVMNLAQAVTPSEVVCL